MSRKKSNFGCFFGIIIMGLLIFIIICMILYYKDPIDFENKINKFSIELNEYIEQVYGKSAEIEEEKIIMPEMDGLTGAQRYYYFQQLSDTSKKIYVTIENSIENLKNGEDNIPLPNSLNNVAKSNEKGKELIATEFQNAWDAFIMDKSEYFYLDSSKVCLVTKITTKGSDTNYEFYIGKGENKNYFIDEFKSKEDVELAMNNVNKIKEEILKNAEGNDYKKMQYVHDWIIDNVEYDTKSNSKESNIYSCLVNKIAICEGYARTYKYLLDELNIPCILISGTAQDKDGKVERHAWNYVRLSNNWYAVDTTWDDPIIIGNGKITKDIKYRYFIKGSKTIDEDHTVSGQITKNGIRFICPELAIEDF